MPASWSQAAVSTGGAVAVPAAGAASASPADTADLVSSDGRQRFDDPVLLALVRSALERNSSIRLARAALAQAQAQRDVAAAGLWPVLDAAASAQRGQLGGRSTGSQFQAELSASWVPDVLGARRALLSADQAHARASAASLGDAQVRVAEAVALDYILLRSSQARWGVANDNLANQRATQQITDWRLQAGLVTVLEAQQARTAAAQTQALLPQLQSRIVQSQHALAVLSGWPPAVWLPRLAQAASGAPAVPQARDDDAQLGPPTEILRQRADVRAADYLVAAAQARVDQAQAQRGPSLAIGGSLGLSAASVGHLTNSASLISSLLASVSAPLLDGGALRAQLRVQQAILGQSRQTYRAVVLTALQEVEDALSAQAANRLRLLSLRVAADAAGQAARLAQQRYRSGLVDFQVVLETQRAQFATQDSVLITSADLASDQVRLFTALGGGWRWTEPDGPAPEVAATETAPAGSRSP